jgi:hypothetical protein
MSTENLIKELTQWRFLLESNHYTEKVDLLDRVIAALAPLQKLEATGIAASHIENLIVDTSRTGHDVVAASLVELAYRNIPTDVQDLLVSGSPELGVAPGALRHMLAAVGAVGDRQVA